MQRHVPGARVECKGRTLGGDMRDIRASFAKIRGALGFAPRLGVEGGAREVAAAPEQGAIKGAHDSRCRNAQLIVR